MALPPLLQIPWSTRAYHQADRIDSGSLEQIVHYGQYIYTEKQRNICFGCALRGHLRSSFVIMLAIICNQEIEDSVALTRDLLKVRLTGVSLILLAIVT
jgi:hypothetical protein